MSITLRKDLTRPLTHDELDHNFIVLNTKSWIKQSYEEGQFVLYEVSGSTVLYYCVTSHNQYPYNTYGGGNFIQSYLDGSDLVTLWKMVGGTGSGGGNGSSGSSGSSTNGSSGSSGRNGSSGSSSNGSSGSSGSSTNGSSGSSGSSSNGSSGSSGSSTNGSSGSSGSSSNGSSGSSGSSSDGSSGSSGSSSNGSSGSSGSNGTSIATNIEQSWSAGQAGAPYLLTDASTIAIDFATGNNFEVRLVSGGTRALGVPTNCQSGQSGVISIRQSSAGTGLVTYPWCYRFAAGTTPTLSVGAYSKDQLAYFCDRYASTTGCTTSSTTGFTWTTHGLSTGSIIAFTSGTLGSLTGNTKYWVYVVDSNTFKVSTTYTNLVAGTYVVTSGTSGNLTCVNMEITINGIINLNSV